MCEGMIGNYEYSSQFDAAQSWVPNSTRGELTATHEKPIMLAYQILCDDIVVTGIGALNACGEITDCGGCGIGRSVEGKFRCRRCQRGQCKDESIGNRF